jgi:predicted DsbA family dithiol-disulfide isomerase
MHVTITYYLEVLSSWCYWAEPAWAELKQHYASKPVKFDWKLALMDESGLPKSRSQCEWFYRRSGTIVRSPFILNAGWIEPGSKHYHAPNLVAEAAKEFGVHDDRARLALATAALREGTKVGHWETAAEIAAQAAGLEVDTLLAKARSPQIEARALASTAEFHSLQVTQRPTFVLKSNIDDRAVFSGLIKAAPIAATIDAMLNDAAGYATHAVHFGAAPAD